MTEDEFFIAQSLIEKRNSLIYIISRIQSKACPATLGIKFDEISSGFLDESLAYLCANINEEALAIFENALEITNTEISKYLSPNPE